MKNNNYMIWMIAGIISVMLIGIPITAYAMSARPPAISEQLNDGDYLQKSYIDNRKVLIKDKGGNVKGYLQRSYMDRRKMLLYDKSGNVKGYLQQDLLDSRKLRFIKMNGN
jgi:hypothetical protein